MPLDRNDTVFAYLSDALFRHMARPDSASRPPAGCVRPPTSSWCSCPAGLGHEGSAGDNLQQLVAGGFLPPDFGVRPDGSQAVLTEQGVYDSLRGNRGLFVPVPDVEVQRITPSELAGYARFSQYYLAKWGSIDPIMAGVRREALEGGSASGSSSTCT